jgi:formyltetrahydrofolate hydrolase
MRVHFAVEDAGVKETALREEFAELAHSMQMSWKLNDAHHKLSRDTDGF